MESKPHASVMSFVHGPDPLASAFQHFESAMERRLRAHFGVSASEAFELRSQAIGLPPLETAFGAFLLQSQVDADAQLLLMLALAPILKPDFFDSILQRVQSGSGDYPQFGGTRGKQHRGFLPTGDTALFLLAGDDLVERIRWQVLLSGEHPLVRRGVVYLDDPIDGDPPMSGRLKIDPDHATLFMGDRIRSPRLSLRFPAQRLETAMEWDDLVLSMRATAELKELENWLTHGHVLMDDWNMRHKLRPGCRALFFGPPGTGKTVTATVLGKRVGREVFKVDLSMVVSKFVGETEKNLAGLFDKAEHKDWILFFDEADALFGKRTQVRDAHDRYANQEVSFLLQRIENYNGLVILASNLAGNVDEAFARRFEHLIHFPMPRQSERLLIWKKGLPGKAELEPGVDLGQIAARYELSGGMIMNVIRHASLKAIARHEAVLRQDDLLDGIRREFAKENRLE